MFAPTAPFGKAASSSCVNLAIIASISAAEMWPLLLRCFWCFAASSGANDPKAIRIASTAAICLRKLSFKFLSFESALLRRTKARDVCHRLGLYPETAQPGSRKRLGCWSILLYKASRVTKLIDRSVRRQQDTSSLPLRRVALGNYTDVKLSKRGLRTWLSRVDLERRCSQLNYVLGVYPEATGQSSQFSFRLVEKRALAMHGFAYVPP